MRREANFGDILWKSRREKWYDGEREKWISGMCCWNSCPKYSAAWNWTREKKIKINFADGSYQKLEEREKKLQKLKSISVMCSPKLLSIGSVQKKWERKGQCVSFFFHFF